MLLGEPAVLFGQVVAGRRPTCGRAASRPVPELEVWPSSREGRYTWIQHAWQPADGRRCRFKTPLHTGEGVLYAGQDSYVGSVPDPFTLARDTFYRRQPAVGGSRRSTGSGSATSTSDSMATSPWA